MKSQPKRAPFFLSHRVVTHRPNRRCSEARDSMTSATSVFAIHVSCLVESFIDLAVDNLVSR
jgi:hypothetical protein